jgi:hypothetical protein
MSNLTTNNEQNQLIELTTTQQNPGAAKPTDFKIEARDGGQRDTALLADADADGKSKLGEPIPTRNEVPAR